MGVGATASPGHVGTEPDHTPCSVHVRVASPTGVQSAVQLYTASEPYVVEERVTSPLLGLPGLPQSMTGE